MALYYILLIIQMISGVIFAHAENYSWLIFIGFLMIVTMLSIIVEKINKKPQKTINN